MHDVYDSCDWHVWIYQAIHHTSYTCIVYHVSLEWLVRQTYAWCVWLMWMHDVYDSCDWHVWIYQVLHRRHVWCIMYDASGSISFEWPIGHTYVWCITYMTYMTWCEASFTMMPTQVCIPWCLHMCVYKFTRDSVWLFWLRDRCGSERFSSRACVRQVGSNAAPPGLSCALSLFLPPSLPPSPREALSRARVRSLSFTFSPFLSVHLPSRHLSLVRSRSLFLGPLATRALSPFCSRSKRSCESSVNQVWIKCESQGVRWLICGKNVWGA